MKKDRKFYVYEHIRLDTMECFYVGKGHGKRAYVMQRNKHHDSICKKYGYIVHIVKDNLSEQESFELERDLIEDYVFNLGYGIDILGLNDYDHNEDSYLTNLTMGGEGVSGRVKSSEERKKLSDFAKTRVGKLNSNYGNHALAGENHFFYGKHHSEETKRKIGDANKGKYTGENNYFYGKGHLQMGEDNPNYGNKWNDEQRKKASDYWKQHSHFSINHPFKKKVKNLDTGEVFDSIKLAKEKYTKGDISSCVRGKTNKAGGYRWSYV